MAQAIGGTFVVAQAHLNLGSIGVELGDLESAEAEYGAALDGFTSIGDKSGVAITKVNLANLARAKGEYARATKLALEGFKEKKEVGDERGMAYALMYLADAEHEQAHLAKASSHYRESLRLHSEIHHLPGVAECLEHMGWLEASSERWERALTMLGVAEQLRDSMGMALSPVESGHHRRFVEQVRDMLDRSRADGAWHRGRAMSRQDMVAFAQSESGC
jgi:tetratricopeptide (TPR) repeat protein